MKKGPVHLILLVVFLLLFVGVSSAQEPFREGASVTIKKDDGTSLTGSIASFTKEITIKSEIGFEAKVDLRETYRIRVLPQKMEDRRMLEFYLTNGKVLRGIYCCGINFEVDLGPYGVQKFNINSPSRFHVEEISTHGALTVGPTMPTVPSMPQPAPQVQKLEAPPFTVLVFPSPITWHDGVSQCQQRGLQIASIHSPQENFSITNQLKTVNWPPNVWHGAWIGLTDEDMEGFWVWKDGSPVDFKNFGPASGEPNGGTSENYAAIELARAGNPDGWWNDARASESYAAVVCKASQVATPPGPAPFPSPQPSPMAQMPFSPPAPPAPQPPMKPMVPPPPPLPEPGLQCIDVQGEATIYNNDVPSAKAEAIARAKWEAIEQTAGVMVKAQTVVQNAQLIDEAISRQIKGVVKNYKVKNEWVQGNTITVLVNVCVERTRAFDAAGLLARNKSIAVFIPARKPRVRAETEIHTGPVSAYGVQTTDEYEETNILSETVIGRLAEAGVTVVDVAPLNLADAQMIEQAMRSGNSMVVRSLMYRTLSNLLLIGKVDYTVSTRKGTDVGYGISMPFNNVTARLTYRLVARDPQTGQNLILASGAEEARGMAPNLEDATAKALRALADRFTPVVTDKLQNYIRTIKKTVIVKVKNVSNISENFRIKEALQNTAWVTEVKEKGLGEFAVGYPENTIYLANSLSQRGFQVLGFTPYEITLKVIR